jgi:hypothetical protein
MNRQSLTDAIVMVLRRFDADHPGLAEALTNIALAWASMRYRQIVD